MQIPIDDNNEKQFQYISSLLMGKGEPFYLLDGMHIYPNILNVNMPFETMHIFAERYNNGEILCPYKYENYINDKDLQATINGLQMDSDAFWLLAIFCFDFACSVCINGFTIKDSARRTIEKFINLTPEDEDSVMKLTLKTDKGKMEIEDSHAITYILKWVKQAYVQNEDTIRGWTAEEAKAYGHSNQIRFRSDWHEIRINVMRNLVWQKFYGNKELREKLLATEDAILIKENNEGDTFWGVCNGVGENHIGKILMDVRQKLRDCSWLK